MSHRNERLPHWLSGILACMAIAAGGGSAPLHAQPDVEATSAPGIAFGGQFGTLPNVSDSLTVTDALTIGDLQVRIDLDHTWIADVALDLLSPSGTTLRLHDHTGADADDIHAVYSDQGLPPGTIVSSFGCAVQPAGPGTMALFDGESITGNWNLIVDDNYPAEDDGILHSWSIWGFSAEPPPAPNPINSFSCYYEPISQEVLFLWNPAGQTYDSFRISQGGTVVWSGAGTLTAASIPMAPLTGAASFQIEGLVPGAAPTCPSQCTVAFESVNEVEACSTPNLAFGGEFGTPVLITDTIEILASTIIADVDVAVTIPHVWIGDVLLDLESPLGTTVRLHNGEGGDADLIDVIFSDDGVTNDTVPYDFGCYIQPAGPGSLVDFTGENPQGTWTVTASDSFPTLDDGILQSWCLRVFDDVGGTPAPSVSNLSCGQTTQPGQISISWGNPLPYQEIQVELDGQHYATLPGSATSLTIDGIPSGTISEITVTARMLGGARSCPEKCSAEVLDLFLLFVRGDANIDGQVDIADAVGMLGTLFVSGSAPLSCHDAADANDDEAIDVADPIYLLGFLFSGGPAAPLPGGSCGSDPTDPETLTCQSYPACVGFTDAALVTHVLRRIAYGPTPTELEEVLQLGVVEYIDQQLEPDLIDESNNAVLNALLAPLSPESDLVDLILEVVARGFASRRQLNEQLTDFWENHFSTYYWTTFSYFDNYFPFSQAYADATEVESFENGALRDAALGSFLALLETSATSVTMLIYLDNILNVAGNPNENYARELLELHTMGVDNGYTQNDIEEVARAFTGWTVCKVAPGNEFDPFAPCLANSNPSGVWAFHFDPSAHDYTAKAIFAGTPYALLVPTRPPGSAQGIEDGFEVLAHLASLPQTAEYVSRKLIQKFVADEVPLALLADCIATWLSTDGDIREVVSTILHSPEFLGPTYRWNKLRTPLEDFIATVRAFGGTTNLTAILNSLFALEQPPFHSITPDGYSEFGADQLSTLRVLETVKFAKLFISSFEDPNIDVVSLLGAAAIDLDDATQVVDTLGSLIYSGNLSPIDRQLAIDFLLTNDAGLPQGLVSAAPDYPTRVRKLATYLLAFPQGRKQ